MILCSSHLFLRVDGLISFSGVTPPGCFTLCPSILVGGRKGRREVAPLSHTPQHVWDLVAGSSVSLQPSRLSNEINVSSGCDNASQTAAANWVCCDFFFSFLDRKEGGVLVPDSRPRICSPLAWLKLRDEVVKMLRIRRISADVYTGFVRVVFVVNGCCRCCCRQSTSAEYRASKRATERVCVCVCAAAVGSFGWMAVVQFTSKEIWTSVLNFQKHWGTLTHTKNDCGTSTLHAWSGTEFHRFTQGS